MRVHFDWQAPAAAGCSSQDDLERGVEALLGRAVFVARAHADAEVQGSLQERDARWVAELALSTPDGAALGHREIFGTGACSGLERALVVVLATLVDAPASARPPPKAAETRRGFAVGLGADVDYGTLPDVALGATVLGEWQPDGGWPAFVLDFSSWLPQDVRSGRGYGGNFWGFRAGLAVCPTLFEGDGARFGVCGGAALGGVRGRGLGLAPDRASYRLTAHVPVQAVLTLHLAAHLSLRLSAGLSLALLRPAFYFVAADATRPVVHRIDPVGADVQLGFIVDRL